MIPTPASVGVGKAHAKTILIGEHSVVYGYPAIAFPMPELTLTATARLLPFPGDTTDRAGEPPALTGGLTLDVPSSATGENRGKRRVPTVGDPSTGAIYLDGAAESAEDELAQSALRAILSHLGEKPGRVEVAVEGTIPTARGLGSSAAMSSAIAEAVARLYSHELASKERFDIVQAVERIAHGTPSGLDAYATMASVPLWFVQGEAEHLDLPVAPALLVADTGLPGRTLRAVSDLRDLREQKPSEVDSQLERLATLTGIARTALELSRWSEVGSAMNDAHGILGALGLSHPALDSLVNSARAAGALGAKLTGGGQGGCIIVLARSEEHRFELENVLLAAGAKHVWRV